MKRHSLLFMLFLSLLLSACSEEKEEAEPETPRKGTVQIKETSKSDLKPYKEISLEVTEESLVALKPGIMMDGYTYEEDIEDIGFKTPELAPELKSKLPVKLEELATETDDLEQIKKGLLALLASPFYKQVIDAANFYEPHFEEPFLPEPTRVEDEGAAIAADNAIILLDASSSMLKPSNGRMKMDIARDAVKSFAKTIGQTSNVSLVVYGHQGTDSAADKELSCSGIEELYPMGKYSKDEFHEAADSFESKGWTPLAGAIDHAAKMSADYEGNTTIYIVSDGAETCDGDPVQAGKDLISKHPANAIHIIGFDVDADAENQLKAVAEAGNGKYLKAENADELKNTIQYEWLPSDLDLVFAFTMAPSGWEMLAEYKNAEKHPLDLWQIGRKESQRIIHAAAIMAENNWITSEQYTEIRDWAFDRSEAIKELHYAMSKTNREKADAKSNEIRQRVDDWVAKMKELKKE